MISFISRQLESLHDLVIVWLIVILWLVIILGYYIFHNEKYTYLLPDSSSLEVIWTLIPILILVTIAAPRIFLLCLQDSFFLNPRLTVKLIRNQWNWQRDRIETYDHLLDQEKLDELSRFDYPFLIPQNTTFRLILRRSDVLHSLGLPTLGVKLDSNPGRLNSTTLRGSIFGLVVGSCYELCGRGHRAMPFFFKII